MQGPTAETNRATTPASMIAITTRKRAMLEVRRSNHRASLGRFD
jgi:hypothetical protein